MDLVPHSHEETKHYRKTYGNKSKRTI